MPNDFDNDTTINPNMPKCANPNEAALNNTIPPWLLRLQLRRNRSRERKTKATPKYSHESCSNWKTLSRKKLFSADPWLRVYREKVRLPDGRIIRDYHQLEIPDCVVVAAMTAEGKILTLHQYKHGARRQCLTLPGGVVDEGEKPIKAAKRELLEETGHIAAHWQHLGTFINNGNLGAGRGHYYLAREAVQVREPNSGDLENMTLVLSDRPALNDSLWNGKITLLHHACAISLACMEFARLGK